MKSKSPISAKRRNWIGLATFAAVGVIPFTLPQAGFAEECTGAQALGNCSSQTNEVSTFSGSNNGQLNMLDLIHRAQFGSLENMEDFTAEQRQNINSAAQNYRNQQLQRVQQGPQEVKPPAAAQN